MQRQNVNSPNLYEKLKFPLFKRSSLDKQRNFWKKIISKHKIKCIFTKQILTGNNFEIDHFICWNFLNHDQEWNLIPVLDEINGIKNNKIPQEKIVKDFIDLKIWPVFNVADSAITIGAFLLIIGMLKKRKNQLVETKKNVNLRRIDE